MSIQPSHEFTNIPELIPRLDIAHESMETSSKFPPVELVSVPPSVGQLNIDQLRTNVAALYDDPNQNVTVVATDRIEATTPAQLTLVPTVEKTKSPKFSLRQATAADIPAIVDVDIRSFDSVYSEYDQDETTLRAELTDKFMGRFEMVGGEWMPVLERDGEIVGFMTCCPTNKTPEDFVSWEDTTDNGTLESTYDPKGENVYVVTLSVLPEGSEGKDMLYANQISKLLREGYKTSFFESRLPGLRDWVIKNKFAGNTEADVDTLDSEIKGAYANEYFNTTVEGKKGKQVRQDRLIRLYERIGCRCIKVVPDAYKDAPSMDFGVVCVYDGKGLFDGSDLPFKVPENRATRWMFGTVLKNLARSPKLVSKVF